MTQAFNLSQFANNVDSSGKAILTSGQAVTGILPVANGGSGASTLTSNAVLLGSGTSSFGTVSPGASGNVLTSNGTTWTSATPAISGQNIVRFITSGSWTVPAGVTKALVTVYGNGGVGASGSTPAYVNGFGGFGGYVLAFVSGLSGTIPITVTAAGSGVNATSFGTYVTATGGTDAVFSGGYLGTVTAGTNGAGSVAGATAIVTGACGSPGVSSSYGRESYEAFFYRPGILSGTNYGRAGLSQYPSTTYAAGAGAVVIQY